MARQLRRSGAGAGAVAPPPPTRRPLSRPVLRPELVQQGRGIGLFLSEVRSELRKVVWPTRREAAKLTTLVAGISVAIGVLLGVVDFAFSELFRVLLQR